MKEPTFQKSVSDALKYFYDPLWLGEHSPLASIYFLGSHLEDADQPETASGRGEALRKVLLKAAESIWPGVLPQSRQGLRRAVEAERVELGAGSRGLRYLFLVLDLRYFRQFYPPRTPPTVVGAMYAYLNVESSTFYRHLAEAVDLLVQALLKLIRPSARLERPVLTHALVGREQVLAESLSALQEKKSVALSGVGGIGKSSLGTAIMDSWPASHSFWYTFRPGLNDELNSLLFSLAHFLHLNGRSGLWLNLIASEGPVQTHEALVLLHEDLERAGTDRILLCFDEVDLLQTGKSQPRHGVHKQVLELLEGLSLITPVLLIGQRALIDTQAHFALQPLTMANVGTLVKQTGSTISPHSIEAVHQATGGNPRLVELIIALENTDDEEFSLILRKKPSARPLFNRLWKRLSVAEKQILANLSVFRTHAPEDEWADHPGLLDLYRRQLIKADAYGGIALLPAFRQLVYDELTQIQRRDFHLHAAKVRNRLAQYTAAAHHFHRAGESDSAVKLWFTVQDTEIAQGNAGAAAIIFNDIRPDQVKGPQDRQLPVIQDRLSLLFGEFESVLDNTDRYSWHIDDELSATALGQWGDAQSFLGDTDAARAYYDDAISTLDRIVNQIVSFQVKKGQAWELEANHANAERVAILAEYEIERFRGIIEIDRGQHRQAQEYLLKARELAQSVDDEKAEAGANYLLAIATGNLGDMKTAHTHADLAMAYLKKVGNRLRLEGLRAEMAGVYLNVGRFAEVIEPAERALAYFEQIKHSHWPGHISSNLAEAYFETGNLEKAEQYARRAIGSENPPVQPYAYYTLGQIFQGQGDPAAANHSFQTGLQWAERNEDSFITAYLHQVYGSCLLEQGQTQEGQVHLTTALNLFSRLGIAKQEEKTRQLLEQI